MTSDSAKSYWFIVKQNGMAKLYCKMGEREQGNSYGIEISYCPMCGRKLKQESKKTDKTDIEKIGEQFELYLRESSFGSEIDKICRDIVARKDSAMAMEFTRAICKLLRKNGVVVNCSQTEFETTPIEIKYGVAFDSVDFSEHDKEFVTEIEYLKRRASELNEECVKKQNEINQLEESCGRMKARVDTWIDYILPRATKKAKEMIDNHNYASVQIVTTDYLEKLNEKQSNDKFTYGEPIEIAEQIITTTMTREKTSMEKSLSKAFGSKSDTVTAPMYSVPEIRQIAEHLLVYCNANKEEE